MAAHAPAPQPPAPPCSLVALAHAEQLARLSGYMACDTRLTLRTTPTPRRRRNNTIKVLRADGGIAGAAAPGPKKGNTAKTVYDHHIGWNAEITSANAVETV
jgi:hypothetical protein